MKGGGMDGWEVVRVVGCREVPDDWGLFGEGRFLCDECDEYLGDRRNAGGGEERRGEVVEQMNDTKVSSFVCLGIQQPT